jgi:hypothetical protein
MFIVVVDLLTRHSLPNNCNILIVKFIAFYIWILIFLEKLFWSIKVLLLNTFDYQERLVILIK